MKYFLVITALLICFTIKAEEKQIASPDGKIVVTISDKNGQPSYRISYKDTPFINSSSLGLITNIGDFSREMSLEHDVQPIAAWSRKPSITSEREIFFRWYYPSVTVFKCKSQNILFT